MGYIGAPLALPIGHNSHLAHGNSQVHTLLGPVCLVNVRHANSMTPNLAVELS